jgi:hypothetical protein
MNLAAEMCRSTRLSPGFLGIEAAMAKVHPGAQRAEPIFGIRATQQFKHRGLRLGERSGHGGIAN